MASTPTLVLASTSRYRRELLARLGLPFVAAAPVADETPLAGEAPRETALRLAEAKARAWPRAIPTRSIIGSDQVADCDGERRRQARRSRARRRAAHALVGQARRLPHRCRAARQRRAGAAGRRWSTSAARSARSAPPRSKPTCGAKQPYDCAGAVKVGSARHRAFRGIESDDPTALIGLPLIRLTSLLRAAGVSLLDPRVCHASASSMRGRLLLVPNLLGLVPPGDVLPARTIAAARNLAHFVVETAKPARAFLKSLSPALPLQQIVDRRDRRRRHARSAAPSCSRPRAPATISGSCRTPAVPASPIPVRSSSPPRIASGIASCRWWGPRRSCWR